MTTSGELARWLHTKLLESRSVATWVVLPSTFVSMLSLFYAYFLYKTREAKTLPDVSQASFPLGSLAGWKDLLLLNRRVHKGADKTSGVCVQWLGWMKALCVTKGEHLDKLLAQSYNRYPSDAGFAKRIMALLGLYHIKKFMGPHSVGVLEGAEWKKVRKFMAHFVQSPTHLQSQFGAVRASADELVSYLLDPKRSSKPQEVSEPLFAMAFDVLSNAVFGERSSFLQGFSATGKMHPVVFALADTMLEMTDRMASINPLDWFYIFDPLRPSQRKFVAAQRAVRDHILAITERRRKDKKESFLYHLLQNASDNVVFDNIQTLMWAGHESTATALSFMFHELASVPDIQQRLREEVTTAVGQDEFEYQHLKKMPLVGAVVDEALRLHPPAIWTNRAVETDVVIDGIHFAKGTLIFAPIWAVHRSPLNWDKPDEFQPDRFLGKSPQPGSFIPFGVERSRRVCPGFKLAPFELRVVLATVMLRGMHFSKGPSSPAPTITANGMFMLCVNNFLNISSG